MTSLIAKAATIPLLGRYHSWMIAAGYPDAIIRRRVSMPTWREWNDAIGDAVFSPTHAGRVVYLAIDREEVEEIGVKLGLDRARAYDTFQKEMRAAISLGWSDVGVVGRYPRCLTHLAVQVVAAFQMHDDGVSSENAYWRRLRQFLGEPPENSLPEKLDGRHHKDLWQGLERWANEANGGNLGRIKLVNRSRGNHLVAEPLGQCLLRRADLTKLRILFAECATPARRLHVGQGLRDLVDDARYRLPNKYFTKHGLRVLQDQERFAGAWEQIEAEYQRFLSEKPLASATLPRPPAPTTREEARPTRPKMPGEVRPRRTRTTVLLQIGRKGLSGGLYRREDGRLSPVMTDIGEVMWQCYLRDGRERSSPPHKPPHDRFIMAIGIDGSGSFFEEKRRCRVGDEVFLLIHEQDEREWPEVPGLFVGEPIRYRPTCGTDRPGRLPLEGLPEGSLGLRLKIRDDLSQVTLCGRWADAVDLDAASLRAEGGLLLRRGVWMLGAGPTVQAIGPGNHTQIVVDGVPRPLDESRSTTLDLVAGLHIVRLPCRISGTLRVRVGEPRRTTIGESVGWRRVEGGWPASTAEPRRISGLSPATLHGSNLIGDWPPRPKPKSEEAMVMVPMPLIPDELLAMTLAASLRSGLRLDKVDQHFVSAARASKNPLVQAMLRASRLVLPFGENHA